MSFLVVENLDESDQFILGRDLLHQELRRNDRFKQGYVQDTEPG